MKKIIFSTNDAKRVLEVEIKKIEIFTKKGHKVYIVCEKDMFYEELKHRIDNVIPLNVNSKKISPIGDLKLIFEYYHIFKKINPDLIFNSTIKPNIYGSIASNFLKIKSISKISGLGSTFQQSYIMKFISKSLYTFSLKNNIKVLFQNQSDASFFNDNRIVQSSQVSIIPTGVKLSERKNFYSKDNTHKTKFLYFGRPILTKGINEYLKSSKTLLSKYDKIEIHLAGDPKSISNNLVRKKIFQMVHKYKNRFFFHGYQKDVNTFIRKFDCVVMPSHREGMSNTLLLAGANAIPSICTDVPGCREIIVNNYNGFLCKPKNSKDLSLKMEKYYHLNTKERSQMSNISYNIVKNNFSFKKVEKYYLNILLKL